MPKPRLKSRFPLKAERRELERFFRSGALQGEFVTPTVFLRDLLYPPFGDVIAERRFSATVATMQTIMSATTQRDGLPCLCCGGGIWLECPPSCLFVVSPTMTNMVGQILVVPICDPCGPYLPGRAHTVLREMGLNFYIVPD